MVFSCPIARQNPSMHRERRADVYVWLLKAGFDEQKQGDVAIVKLMLANSSAVHSTPRVGDIAEHEMRTPP